MMNENQTTTYNYVIDKLEKAKNPEIMLNELVQNRGTPYITEDMVFIIERRIHDEWERMNNILLANPNLTLQEFPGYRDKIEKLEQIRDIFNERAGFEVKSQHQKISKVETETTHKLAAVMFTDIVGYTALMGKDEFSAFKLLIKNRELQKPIIEQYKGTWIKELGDGVMATFNSAFEAVRAAIIIQDTCKTASDFQLRIGIHLGDVIFENHDIFGDTVNIASRIQGEAEPGSILISEIVNQSISSKSNIQTEFAKETTLKNVKGLIRLYEVKLENTKNTITETTTINYELGNYFIGISTKEFFTNRLANAFPGIRKLTWFEDPHDIIDRFKIFFRKPLVFTKKLSEEMGYINEINPIWWYRGLTGRPIENFIILSEDKCLLGTLEFVLSKIAVYKHEEEIGSSFIYIEVKPEMSVFQDKTAEETTTSIVQSINPSIEEYALFDNSVISKEEYNDGAATIDGKVVLLNGRAKLRQRCIEKFNFIICAQTSAYSTRKAFHIMKANLDKILAENATLEEVLPDIIKIELKYFEWDEI